ncbi:Ankyrin repeat and sterile alpha motif domain-containing protein 1B, partial [Pseudolycoriella hygida]
LRRGPSANVQDSSGYSSLHHAVLNGHTDVVRILLMHDASPDLADSRGSSPLHLAAWAGHQDIVKLLLTHPHRPADPNRQTIDNETPLHCAAQHGHTGALTTLLAHGADPNVPNSRNETPLDLAAQYGRLQVVQMLIRAHPELLMPFRHECTVPHSPLHLASRNGHKSIVDVLLAAGVNVNLLTASGTALHEAALHAKDSVVRTLLDNGADLDATDSEGRTALDLLEQFPPKATRAIVSVINNHRNSMVDDSEFDDNREGMNSKYIHSLGSSHENNRGALLYNHWDSQPDGTSPSSSMGSLGPPSPSTRPRSATAETPGYYVAMSPLNRKLSPTPPKKPPRRNLSVSPTHLDGYQSMMSTSMDSGSEMNKTPKTGAYEYLFLARSGAKSHSDLDEFRGKHTSVTEQYVKMSPPRQNQPSNKPPVEAAFRSYNPNRKLRRNRDNYFSMDRSVVNASEKNSSSGYIPMSPSNYKQPPTPEHPPPNAMQAEKCILDRIRPLSQEYKRRSMNIHDVAERGTSPPDQLYASSGSLSSSVSLSDRSASTDCVEEFIGDIPFAGLFKGSTMNLDNPNYSVTYHPNRDCFDYPPTNTTLSSFSSIPNQRISQQYFDQSIINHNRPERPKTLGTGPVRKSVSMESSQYTLVPVGHGSKQQQDDKNKKTEFGENIFNIENGGTSSKQSNSVVLSPFDEQEEWAKISEIMAAFGTDLLLDGSNNGTKPNRKKVRGSISSTKSLGSPIDPPPTPLSLLVDWLYDNELEDLERILVSHGYDDYYFINGVLQDEDIEIIGVPPAERAKLSEAIKSLPYANPIIENNNENSNLSIAQWLHEIRLDEYADVFRRHLIIDMERICRIWEIELQTVIEIHKIGHRKRMLHSVGLPICKKKDEKRNQMFVKDINGSGDSKSPSIKSEEGVSKALDQSNQTNGHKMNYGKNRPAPQPPNLSTNLEIRAPSELLLGVPTGLKTQWRHTANKLVSSAIRYENVNYLGSTLVKELRGTESTRKSIQKLKRGERVPPNFNVHINSVQDSHRPIILSISHRGVQFFEVNTQGTICEHEIRNIDCACQDADDLTHFAYITKDLDFDQHYCHVFNAESMDLATEIILTLGQAFEVAYQLALRETPTTSAKTPVRSPQAANVTGVSK